MNWPRAEVLSLRWLAALGTAAVLAMAGTHGAPPVAPENTETIAALREVMDKWVEVQKALAKEKSEAKIALQLLEQRIELVSLGVEEFREKKRKAASDISEADKARDELVAKQDEVRKSLEDLAKDLPEFEKELRELQPLLPDPLQEKLRALFERIPGTSEAAKVTLAERYQNVVGILNEVNKANQEVNLVDEQRTLDDGKPSAVKTLYVGLGQAYFVNVTGKKAGTGRPGPKGWEWQQNDSIAGPVRHAIGMLQSKSAAQFVSVPIEAN